MRYILTLLLPFTLNRFQKTFDYLYIKNGLAKNDITDLETMHT